jgi:predicted aspartyl protease
MKCDDPTAEKASHCRGIRSLKARTGTLYAADFREEKTYVLANGSTERSQTFRIRSLKVGNTTFENVTGSTASEDGSPLLGQSFLSRLKSWSIDNRRQVLVLE